MHLESRTDEEYERRGPKDLDPESDSRTCVLRDRDMTTGLVRTNDPDRQDQRTRDG